MRVGEALCTLLGSRGKGTRFEYHSVSWASRP